MTLRGSRVLQPNSTFLNKRDMNLLDEFFEAAPSQSVQPYLEDSTLVLVAEVRSERAQRKSGNVSRGIQ